MRPTLSLSLAFALAACSFATHAPVAPVAAREATPAPLAWNYPGHSLQAQRVGLTRRLINAVGDAVTSTASSGISLIQFANSRLEINPSLHDPLTAVGACADLVTYCFTPPSVSLDQCVSQARACTTNQPWREPDCCPVACRDAYDRARRAGLAPMDAFQQVFFLQPDCFPGVRDMIAERH